MKQVEDMTITVSGIQFWNNENGKGVGAYVDFNESDGVTKIATVPVRLPYELDLTLAQIEELAIATAKGKLLTIINKL